MVRPSGMLLRIVAVLATAGCCTAVPAFDAADLKGLWAESTLSRYACKPGNRHQRMELSSDGQSLKITVTRGSSQRKSDMLVLRVVNSDEHSLYFTLPRPADASPAGEEMWAMTMLGPGVYRWHMTSEHESPKAAPIGVRCGD